MFRFKVLATRIDEAYKQFHLWQTKCQTMDEWLIEKEHLTKDVKGISVENLKALHSKNEVNVSN